MKKFLSTFLNMFVIFIVVFFTQSIVFADVYLTGKVKRVIDGDTIVVESATVRLYGIDCPEKDQPFGSAATTFTKSKVEGKLVRVKVITIDKYGRTIGEVVSMDGVILNQELVAAGYAWWYWRYAPFDDILKSLEEKAKQNRLGLWISVDPIPPWEWRKGKQ